MTKQSYQNRIKTGGSLVRRSKASTAFESGGEDSELKPIVRGVLTDSSLGQEDPKITRHFRPNLMKKPNPFVRSSFNAPPLSQRPMTELSMVSARQSEGVRASKTGSPRKMEIL